MSRPDLRGLFRVNDPNLVPNSVFSDRVEEWDAVSRSLARCVEWVRSAEFDVTDVEAPRRNILVFYGVGGIGKTTLSRKFMERLSNADVAPEQWPDLDPALGDTVPVRVDMSRKNGADFETVLLAVRLAVTEIGRPMPTFDLAFQRYWKYTHPGEPLDEYLRGHRSLSRISSSDALRSQMQTALSDVAQALLLPGTLGTLTEQGIRSVVGALRERRAKARALAGCTRFPDLLEAPPDLDALSYYPHLLAWDLARLSPNRRATPVVLLDTFEDVSNGTHRDLERLIQRLVWLMPNALFVVTGRNRLRWDDERLEGQLDWVGERFWPDLVPGATRDPRQHRVGHLSDQDSEDYLQRRLTIGQRPLIGETARRRIVERAQGLPLYLDLAVMRFLDLYRRDGHAPGVDEFDHDFPALVARTFRDLTPPERQVLRSVCLLDSFSVELATAAAGLDRESPALRLIERPFVERDITAPWPYQLHDLVRSAVRDADSTSEDRWSSGDWRTAAQRAFDALGREFHERRDPPDRKHLTGCLRQGLRLAHEYRLDVGWLTDAAFEYVADFVWEPIEVGIAENGADTASDATGGINSPADALGRTLTAISRRQRHDRRHSARSLRAVLESGLLPEELWELPRYFVAECERDLGDLDASMEGMRAVAAANGRLAADASRGLTHVARRLGRFPDVLDAAEELGPRGKRHRALGDLWWTQGRISLACACYARSRDDGLEGGRRGEAALSQACLAFAAAFQERSRAQEEITRAEEMLAGSQARFAELQVANAHLLHDAGGATDLADRAERVVDQAMENGLTSPAAYARFASCFHAAVLGSAELLTAARTALRACLRGEEFSYLLELTYLMVGQTPESELPRAHWIDGADETRARWMRLVDERRQEPSSASGS